MKSQIKNYIQDEKLGILHGLFHLANEEFLNIYSREFQDLC
jgi:hypothetical protein